MFSNTSHYGNLDLRPGTSKTRLKRAPQSHLPTFWGCSMDTLQHLTSKSQWKSLYSDFLYVAAIFSNDFFCVRKKPVEDCDNSQGFIILTPSEVVLDLVWVCSSLSISPSITERNRLDSFPSTSLHDHQCNFNFCFFIILAFLSLHIWSTPRRRSD